MSDNLLDTLGRKNRKIPDKECENCGKIFRLVNSKHRTCSRECGYKIRKSNHPLKNKGKGWVNQKGYKELRIDGNKVKEHRYLMEKHLGRKLLLNEDVHHINGNKTDNRIENLKVMKHGTHTIITNLERRNKKLEQMNCELLKALKNIIESCDEGKVELMIGHYTIAKKAIEKALS